jgi:hypothetical protein
VTSPPDRSRRPTPASHSLSTLELSWNLLPGSPRASRASRSAIRVLFLAEAARLETSNAGARILLGRERNRDATTLETTPLTNSTHAIRSAGGRATEPCGTLDALTLGGYAAPARRRNNTARGDSTRQEALSSTCTDTPPLPSRCSICVPATGSISGSDLLLQGRTHGKNEAMRNFHMRKFLTDARKARAKRLLIRAP